MSNNDIVHQNTTINNFKIGVCVIFDLKKKSIYQKNFCGQQPRQIPNTPYRTGYRTRHYSNFKLRTHSSNVTCLLFLLFQTELKLRPHIASASKNTEFNCYNTQLGEFWKVGSTSATVLGIEFNILRL